MEVDGRTFFLMEHDTHGDEAACIIVDDSEGMVSDAAEIKAHAAQGGIFGVEKTDWQAVIEKENHLKFVEMSTEDD